MNYWTDGDVVRFRSYYTIKQAHGRYLHSKEAPGLMPLFPYPLVLKRSNNSNIDKSLL